jgi:hypothetical protein
MMGDEAPTLMLRSLLLAAVAALSVLSASAAHAETNSEECSCVGNTCNMACMSPASPEVVAALRKRFPDLYETTATGGNAISVFDSRQLPPRRSKLGPS